MKAYVPGKATQQTAFDYGMNASNTQGVFSNERLYAIRYADPANGNPWATVASSTAGQSEYYDYNAAGEMTTKMDRNRTLHAYAYDDLGRLRADRAVAVASGIDGTVRSLRYDFDGAGRLSKAVSVSTAASLDTLLTTSFAVNTVTRTYDGLGNLTKDVQPYGSVDYAFSMPTATVNQSAATGMSYGFEALTYGVDALGRTTSLSAPAAGADLSASPTPVTIESYEYLGLGTLASRLRPELGTFTTGGGGTAGLRYYKLSGEADGAAGDKYTGLDRFGRVADQRWLDGSGASVDRLLYGYDPNSNPLFKSNAATGGNAHSELYTYDGLNRVVTFKRGALTFNSNGVGQITSPTRSQAWTLDAVGNWGSLSTDSGTAITRVHDAQNRLTSIGTATATYDAAGNQTTDPAGHVMRYDAWGRMVEWASGPSTTVIPDQVDYPYDALNRRIKRHEQPAAVASVTREPRLYVVDLAGLPLWSRWQGAAGTGGAGGAGGVGDFGGGGGEPDTDAGDAYIWSPVLTQTLVARDSVTAYASGGDPEGDPEGGGGGGGPTGTYLTARVYAEQDVIGNTAATLRGTYDPAAETPAVAWDTARERYASDPYGGNALVLNDDFTSKSGGSDRKWTNLFQGGFTDPVSGLIHFGAREYDPVQGRWTRQDPSGWPDGANGYEFVAGSPILYVDPEGTDRYLGGTVHNSVAVDTWEKDKDGRWIKTGQKTFDFSVARNWLGFLGLVLWKGEVLPSDGLNIDDPTTWKSTPEQDIEMLKACEQSVINPPLYGIVVFNCRDYSRMMALVGMNK